MTIFDARQTTHLKRRVIFMLALPLGTALFAVAGSARGDSIDDAEAKKRGVAVEVVQLEHAKARIAELEVQVAALQKQLTAATQPKPAVQAAAATNPATTLPAGTVIQYGGRPRTQAWLDSMYKQFGDKISLVDGKYYDIGRAILIATDVADKGAPNVGDLRTADARWEILSVLKPDEALVVRSKGYGETSGFVFHVKNFSTKNLSDGSLFTATPKDFSKLVFVGTFKYTAAGGAAKTVPSYIVYASLTSDQFAEAIRAGLKLTNYKLVVTYTPNHFDAQGVRYVNPDDKIDRTVVETPIN